MKKVQSKQIPESTQTLQGKILVNYCIEELSNEDGIYYQYLQESFSSSTSAETIKVFIEDNERKFNMLQGEIYTLNGIDYLVSFSKDDGDGLIQVKNAFEMGLTNTIIHFDNGTKMPITSTDFSEFALWFIHKRNEFFVGV